MHTELTNAGGLERLRIDLVGHQLHRLFGRNFLRALSAPQRVAAARLLLRAIARAGIRDRHLDDHAVAEGARPDLAPLDLHRVAILIGKPLDDLCRVGANVVEECLARLGAVLDLLQPMLPVASQRRAGDVVVAKHLDDGETLRCSQQLAARALDVLVRDQILNRLCSCGRRSETRVAHRCCKFFVVDQLARGLHRLQQRVFGEVPGRRGLLGEHSDVADRARLALGEGRQERLLVLGIRRLGLVGFRGRCVVSRRYVRVDREEARLDDDRARRAEQFARGLGVDGRDFLLGGRMKGREKTTRHEVVDLALIGTKRRDVLRCLGRNDRVMVANLVVGDDASQRQRGQASHVRGGLGVGAICLTNLRSDALQRIDHVGRQVLRARTRVRQQLVRVVEALGGRQRALGGKAKLGVGFALQLRQIEQQLRLLDARLLLDPHDFGIRGGAHCRGDRLGLVGCRRALRGPAMPLAGIRRTGLAGEVGDDLPIRHGDKGVDLFVAARD